MAFKLGILHTGGFKKVFLTPIRTLFSLSVRSRNCTSCTFD